MWGLHFTCSQNCCDRVPSSHSTGCKEGLHAATKFWSGAVQGSQFRVGSSQLKAQRVQNPGKPLQGFVEVACGKEIGTGLFKALWAFNSPGVTVKSP